MESRLVGFRNVLGPVVGLLVGFIAMTPVAVKAIAMLPVISLLSPVQNQDVAGSVTFQAWADSEGLVSLQFKVDGEDFGSAITAGPCWKTWDSTEAIDGLHTVQAVGHDQFNNVINSQPVTVRVNNFVAPPTAPPPTAPPPTAPPPTAPPPTAPPPAAPPPTPTPTPTPPAPPGSNTPMATATILSPSPNTVVKGVVPVFVAVPAQTQTVVVHLRTAWGEPVGQWQVQLTPSASSTTVQVNAEIGNLAAASYALVAMASVNGAVVTSEPVPVRVENTTVTPPPAPPQTPAPPPSSSPVSPVAPRLTPASRTKSPTTESVEASGSARPRPQAKVGSFAERAIARSSAGTSTQTKTQKSSAPSTSKSTSLPAGSVVTIGLGSCKGTDPYAKHATLRGECVSGTWFPRVRKAEPRRQD